VRSPVADLLDDLRLAFDDAGLSWYLFGAQAAIVYGVARLTADVDVTVHVPPGLATAEWVATAERHGFEARFTDPGFIATTRVVPLVHRRSGLPVDVVVAGPGLEEAFLTRAVRHRIDDVQVPVIDVSDLVVLKVLAGRPKDEEDVAALVRIQAARLDHRHIEAILRQLEDALGQSDLQAAWARARARASS